MRIGRVGFILGNIPLVVATTIVSHVPGYHRHLEADPTKLAVVGCLVLWAACLTAWRCHDYNKSAWGNFFTDQIPIVGPFLALWDLVAAPGSEGFNSYGAPPTF